ncbi:hypothetical protein ACLOJK_035345 [Asimina triloba]
MAPPMADDAAADLISAHRRCCCCFWTPSLDSDRSSRWRRTWTEGIEGGMRWWKGWDGVRWVKEWSEMVAGPRWKTFLRRFCRRGGGGGRHGKCQYDPLSYALNFDDGHGQNGNLEGDYGYCDFSSRYAAAGGGKLLVDEEEKEGQDLGKGAAGH